MDRTEEWPGGETISGLRMARGCSRRDCLGQAARDRTLIRKLFLAILQTEAKKKYENPATPYERL